MAETDSTPTHFIREIMLADKASGKASLLTFGVPREQAENALANVAGKADDRSDNNECGAGPMAFTRFDAMTLNFQDGKFVGWFLGNEKGAVDPRYPGRGGGFGGWGFRGRAFHGGARCHSYSSLC